MHAEDGEWCNDRFNFKFSWGVLKKKSLKTKNYYNYSWFTSSTIHVIFFIIILSVFVEANVIVTYM